MSQALIGQSYYLRLDPKLWSAMKPYPPLGSMYAASYLRDRGYDTALFDAMLATGPEAWDAALQRHRPQFAVLYEDNFNYLSKMCLLAMREAAFAMISAGRRRGCTVIVCGSDASDHAEDYLKRGADFVLIGEGEQTLGELIDRLAGHTDVSLNTILGLAFVETATGDIVRTPRRPDIRDLDALPFPSWSLIDVDRYRDIWYRRHGYFSMNAVTTRGCPYHCNWCAKPIWGQRYNSRSPENVADELAWLKTMYRPDHLWFADDILGLKPGWLQRFADAVERRDASIPFKSLHRVDLLLRHDTISALKRAGARTVWVGAESGSQKILDAMDKGTRVEHIYEARRRLRTAGIEVGFFLQFGYPGEGREEIEQTLKMVRECRPDDIGVSVSYPLPGTVFYRNVEEQLRFKRNWTDSDDLAMLYQGPYGSDFYRQLHAVVHSEFRMRNAVDDLRDVIRQPHRVRRRHLRQIAVAARHAAALPLARARLDRMARTENDAPGAAHGNGVCSSQEPRTTRLVPPSTVTFHVYDREAPETPFARPQRQDRETVRSGANTGDSNVDANAGVQDTRGEFEARARGAIGTDEAQRLMDTRRAFNGVAGFYDGPFGNNELIQRMRNRLIQAVQQATPPGSRLLDLGCGTGIDAVALALRGYRVVAVDWSPSMVDRTMARAAASGVRERVRNHVVGIHELDRLGGEQFDAIYSDLGPFNCVPDLESAARSCAGMLAPGGALVVSVMGRACPWEIAYFAARGNARRAALRASRDVVPAPLHGGVVWTRYFTPREFARACMPWFQVKSYQGLGVVVPPPYMLALHTRLRGLAPFIESLDDTVGSLPVGRELGDHFLMVLTRRGVIKIDD